MARVFIVDDNPRDLEDIKRRIEITKENTVTLTAPSAYLAMQLLESSEMVVSFDIAVIDGLDGLGPEIAFIVKHWGKPVVAYSGNQVTFGDINISKADHPQRLLDAIAKLTGM